MGVEGDIDARTVEGNVVQTLLHIDSCANGGMFAGVDVSFE